MQEEFLTLKDKLIALGEDAQEFALISELFSSFDEQAKVELIANMKKEIETLEKLEK